MGTRRYRLRGTGLVVALALVLGGMGLVAPPAISTPGTNDYPTTLRTASRDALVDKWLFYNRECTSFVAWRLNYDNWGVSYAAKQPFWNYYLGQHWGNANHWSTAAKAAGIRVDTTPAVGAVAYWLAGKFGHVAWVRYVTSTTVTIEEYNYVTFGGYSTRTLTKGAANYPTGFIHVHDLGNTARPVISGTAQVGTTLTANPGTWQLPGATYRYQWVANGTAVPGATGTTYTPTAAQLGLPISVRVTGSKPGVNPIASYSVRTAPVQPDTVSSTTPPSISGTPQVGVPLAADPGTWSVPGATYGYQWLANGTRIPGATGQTYVPTPSLVNQSLTVQVTARATGYASQTVASGPVGPVALGTDTNLVAPSVAGTPQVGDRLVADPGQWSAPGATYSYQWLVDGNPISGATQSSFVPTADQLDHTLAVTVSVSAPGYTDTSLVSASTDAVAPGTIALSSGPAVRGRNVVGHELRESDVVGTPGAQATLQWLRDGRPVAGQTGRAYPLRRVDIGHRIAVQATYSLAGYSTLVATSTATAPVRVMPWLVARRSVTSGKVTLDIRVGARGAPQATGRVQVSLDRQVVRRPRLAGAAASVTLRRLPRGWHSFRVAYLGNRVHTGKTVWLRVWVPR